MGSITGIKTKSLSKSELEKNIDVMLNCFRLKNVGEVIFDTNGYVGMGFINERIEDDSNSIYYRVGFSEVMVTLDGKIDNREAIFSQLKISSSEKITDNLDESSAQEVVNFLIELKREGKMIIQITHDLSLAAKSDVIYDLKKGSLHQYRTNRVVSNI